jgi:hypothetical protein
MIGNSNRWELSFELQSWHEVGGEIDDRKLTIWQRGLSERQIEKLAEALQPESIVRLRVHFPARTDGPPTAELVKFVGQEKSDAKINKRAKQLKKPATHTDRYFGKFKLDRAMNWWVTRYNWGGRKIELCLPLDECKDEEALFRLAEGLCKQQKKWDHEVRDFAAKQLVKRKNKSWLDEGEEPITPDQFKKRIKLEAITLDPDGSFEFSYADGGVFRGHIIMVGGTLKKGPRDASVEG